MLSVPEPLPNDPEDVVSALEFAEHYGKQGDLKEAVRWVRRAAEIAGDTGSDERALTLARAVADLNISASQPPQPPPPEEQAPEIPPLQAQPTPQAEPPLQTQAEPPLQAQPTPQAASLELPPPPPLPGAGSATYDPDGDAETRVVDSAQVLADFHKQSNGNGSALSTPIGGIAALGPSAASVPTPIAALVPTPVAGAVETLPEPPPPPPAPPSAAMVDTAPAPTPEAEDSIPPSRRPVGSMAELLARKEAEVSSAIAAAEGAVSTDTTWDEPPPPPPPQPSTPPVERRTAHPAANRVTTPLIPSQPYLDRPPVNAPIHQAVRASIVATAEPGVFVLRVLTAEQGPSPTGHEVLVVVTDSNSSPF